MALPRPIHRQRAARVKLLGSVLALVRLDDGHQFRCRLHQLSTNGGVLHVSDALQHGAFVQLTFHVRSTTVRTAAEILPPMWATAGHLQPFRFTGLSEEQRSKLGEDLKFLLANGRINRFHAGPFRLD
jgi:hypothetical protein